MIGNNQGCLSQIAARHVTEMKHFSALSLVFFLETKTAENVEMQLMKSTWSGQKIQNRE